jgi:hypothetical protein
MNACWAKAKQNNPKLFGDLQAADWMAEDRAREEDQEPQPNRFNYYHGDMQPPSGSQNPYSTFEEHKALFAKLQGPKNVEATHQEGFICVGVFSNPLF